jgi:hypothetical protein
MKQGNPFLKINLRKIVIFIVLILVFSYLPIIPAIYHYKCVGCNFLEYRNFWMTEWGINSTFTVYTYLVIILEILVAYLLSCVIDKFVLTNVNS